MASAVGLRKDFDGSVLRGLARRSKDAGQARRLLALAEIYDGGSRGDAARIGGVTLQSVRDWVVRFNAQGPMGLIDVKAPGPKPKLDEAQHHALKQIVEAGPIPAIHGVVRWRLVDLVQWLHEEFAVSLDETTVGRQLKAMEYAKLSARPRHHAQNAFAVEAFKKNFPAEIEAIRARLEPGVEIELWFQDEARIGQKNRITRRWAKRGTRPIAPHDQRTQWTYIFGAICPAKRKAIGLVLPWCNTEAMSPSPRDRRRRRSRRPCRPHRRSGRLAYHRQTSSARQHHHPAVAAKGARTEPGREPLAVHARQLALQPRLPIPRSDRRSVLRGLEPAARPALAHHVHRTARLGSCMIVNAGWY